MGSERRKQILLLALVGVLALVVGYQVWSSYSPQSTTGDASAASNVRGASRAQAAPPLTAPDVHLAELSAEHPTPDSADRNLFRFKERPLPPPPPRPIAPVAPVPPARSGPPPAPTVPPIRLKFIGYIQTESGQKIALLSDGLGRPEHVVEGGTALGQYKIWRIGVESIDISYLDGRGRQTIRLNGQ
jgi:hypothetical protein